MRVPIAVTATANTDFPISLPPGASIDSIRAFTTAAFTAGTDAKLSVGSTVGGVDYVAQTTIAAIGVASMALVNAAAASLLSLPPTSPNLYLRLTQSGTATAVGAATILINYVLP
jgi:hypothetical protein